jgi:hypothetical protein
MPKNADFTRGVAATAAGAGSRLVASPTDRAAAVRRASRTVRERVIEETSCLKDSCLVVPGSAG